MKIWITRDRRMDKGRIVKDLIEGNITSIYFSLNAAACAAYPTEIVWEAELDAKQVSSTGAVA